MGLVRGGRRRPLRRLLAGLLLPIGATSLTGIGVLAAYHPGKARSVDQVPGLAEALAPPTKTVTPVFHHVPSTPVNTPPSTPPSTPVNTPPSTPVHLVTTPPTSVVPVTAQPVPVTTTTVPKKKPLPVEISLVAGSGATSLLAPLSDLVPGDVVEREVDLANTGKAPIASVTISAAPTQDVSLLSAADGLTLEIRRCAGTWSIGSVAGGEGYVCSGQESSTDPIVVSGLSSSPVLLSGLAVGSPGGVSHLVFRFELPSSAGNDEAGQSSGIAWTFTAEAANTGS